MEKTHREHMDPWDDPTRKLIYSWIGSNNKTIGSAGGLVQYFIIPTHNLVPFTLKAKPL